MRAPLQEDAQRILDSTDLSWINNKSLLITGATGVVGTYLVATLNEYSKRSSNTSFKTFAVGSQEPLSLWTEILDFPKAKYLKGDLSDLYFLESLPPADLIIHAAGYGQPGKFLSDPLKTIELNTTCTSRLFQKLKPQGKFVFLSTSELYVGLQQPPHHEDEIGTTNTNAPRACYIEGKRCGEAICHAMKAQGKDAKIARLALGYGPGTRLGDQRVLHSFIERGLQDGKIQLLDRGLARRTYAYISDVVEMLWNLTLRGQDTVYNIGGISRTTIGELAERIGQLLEVPVIFPNQLEALKGAPADVQLDLTRICSEFNKTQFVPLEEGLKKTIEWQRALLVKTTQPQVNAL